jgi:hypothetical protein
MSAQITHQPGCDGRHTARQRCNTARAVPALEAALPAASAAMPERDESDVMAASSVNAEVIAVGVMTSAATMAPPITDEQVGPSARVEEPGAESRPVAARGLRPRPGPPLAALFAAAAVILLVALLARRLR